MTDISSSRPINRLADETSAYLRQHMHNPVDWYPWGDEALERARSEDRPLLISIGYSACHWCHVMEHESFEDADTAEQMNGQFICIKVDREERPDLDQIYMDAVTGLTGHGGWPLTVFCTPDGRPFYGGTYFPPQPRQGMPSFRQILTGIGKAYREQRDDVERNAAQIIQALARRPAAEAAPPAGASTAAQATFRLLQRADPEHGGFGTAPKFPTPTSLDLMLAALDALPEAKARESLEHVQRTCREMARGGIYDHVGGGFHRYSVDAHWGVPHFEKMLYDLGQLVRTYSETWRVSGGHDDDLLWPIYETVDFLEREMRAPEGGWYASLDADSEGAEGTFYVWTPAQIAEVLGPARGAAFCDAYQVTERGNFENGSTVLREVADRPRAEFAEDRAALLNARAKRIRPDTDPKRVTAWNAYTISGLARAGSLLRDASMIERAAGAADFLLESVVDPDGRLLRIFDAGRAHVPAFLDDHAALLEACLDLQRAGAGERYLGSAMQLADAIASRFFDPAQGDLFLTAADGERLAHRPRSDHDGATPHSAGLAAFGMLRAATLAGRKDWRNLVDRVLEAHATELHRVPEAFPTLCRVLLAAERGLSLALIVGDPQDPATEKLAERARILLNPEDAVLVVAPGTSAAEGVDPRWLSDRVPLSGQPTAYVCRGVSCSLPVTNPDDLAPLAHETPRTQT